MGSLQIEKGLKPGYHELADMAQLEKTKGIKFLNINIGSFNKKESEFRLAVKNSRADFVNVCETWCKEGYDMAKININGYRKLRQDRNTKTSGGGLMVFIKKGFKVNELKYSHLNCSCKNCELQVYVIELPQTKPLVVLNCYKPPHVNADILLDKLSTALENINIQAEIMVVGDTNIDYAITTGARQQKLKNFENRFQLKQLIKSVTRPKVKSNTVIDHIYSNSEHIHTYGTTSYKPADHVATFAIRKKVKRKIEHEWCRGRRAKDFDEDKFETEVNSKDWAPFYFSNDINSMWDTFKTNFISALDKICPVNEFIREKPVEKWLTHDILEVIDRKNAAIKRAIRTKSQNTWDIANTLQKETRELCNKARNDFVKDTLLRLEKKSRLFWKKVTPKINKKKAHLTDFDQNSNNQVENKFLANKFNKFFSNVGNDLNLALQQIKDDELATLKQRLPNTNNNNIQKFSFTKITESNILKLIEKIDIHKASGIPEISSLFLKNGLKRMHRKFTFLINKILETCTIPNEWKIGVITPIFKNTGKKEDPNNFRPISVLPAPAKLFEKIINSQIRIHIESNNLYSDKQFGFRSSLSTKDAIEKVVNFISINQNASRNVVATFVDLRKAFDVVNHKILLEKLKNMFHFGNESVSLIANYLRERKQATKFNGEVSDYENINIGVPQGSVLGPTLFGLYINELDSIFATSEVFLYADDTVILTSHPNLDVLVDILNNDLKFYYYWLKFNRLTINLGKTKFIVYKGHGQQINSKMKQIKIGQGTVLRCENYTYLGVVLDSRMAFDSHVKKMNKEVSFRLSMFFKLRPCLTEKLAVKIYKIMILPVIDYGDIFYASGYQNVLNKIDLLQNRAVRMIGKLNKRDHVSPTRARLEIEELSKRRLKHLLELSYVASLSLNNHKYIQKTTRFNHKKKILKTDKVNSDIYKRSSLYKSRIIWNSLNQEYHNCENLISFRTLVAKNIDSIFNKAKNILINKKE